ncbi:MAG: DUF4430 domain-containing protein [Acholeplasmatales bacterium]|nr:DUF4430 domain-containing protein [Acholeplasmatales bacterium]
MSNKAKWIIKILISISLICICISLFIVFNNLKGKDEKGIDVTIILKDKNNNVCVDDTYHNNDLSLVELLRANYEVRMEKSTYGYILYDFEEIKTDFKNSYLAIYVNDQYSNYGISGIVLKDDMIILFKETII